MFCTASSAAFCASTSPLSTGGSCAQVAGERWRARGGAGGSGAQQVSCSFHYLLYPQPSLPEGCEYAGLRVDMTMSGSSTHPPAKGRRPAAAAGRTSGGAASRAGAQPPAGGAPAGGGRCRDRVLSQLASGPAGGTRRCSPALGGQQRTAVQCAPLQGRPPPAAAAHPGDRYAVRPEEQRAREGRGSAGGIGPVLVQAR